jgi:hypothetical protein
MIRGRSPDITELCSPLPFLVAGYSPGHLRFVMAGLDPAIQSFCLDPRLSPTPPRDTA